MRDKQLAAVLHEGEEEVQGSSRRKEIQELLWACQSDNMAEDTLEWEGEERRGERREEKGKEGKGGKRREGKGGERREGKGGERGRVETLAIIQEKVMKVNYHALNNVCTNFRGLALQYRSVFLSSNLIG